VEAGQLLALARKQTVSPKVLGLNDAVANTQKMIQRLIGEDIDLAVNARDAIGGVGKLTIETGKVSFDQVYCATHSRVMGPPSRRTCRGPRERKQPRGWKPRRRHLGGDGDGAYRELPRGGDAQERGAGGAEVSVHVRLHG